MSPSEQNLRWSPRQQRRVSRESGGSNPQTPTSERSLGRGRDSLGSKQGSATSELQSVALATHQLQDTSSEREHDSGHVIVGMLEDGDSLDITAISQVAMETDLSQIAVEMVPEQSLAPPPVALAMEGDVATGTGREQQLVSTDITMGTEVAHVGLALEQVDGVIETGLTALSSSSMPLESAHDDGHNADISNVGLESAHDADISNVGLEPADINNVELESAYHPEDVHNAGALHTADISSIGLADGGGSIMASASDLYINISGLPQAADQLAPASPILPIQEEVVVGGDLLGEITEDVGGEDVGGEEGEDVSVAGEEDSGITFGVTVSRPRSLTGDAGVLALPSESFL